MPKAVVPEETGVPKVAVGASEVVACPPKILAVPGLAADVPDITSGAPETVPTGVTDAIPTGVTDAVPTVIPGRDVAFDVNIFVPEVTIGVPRTGVRETGVPGSGIPKIEAVDGVPGAEPLADFPEGGVKTPKLGTEAEVETGVPGPVT